MSHTPPSRSHPLPATSTRSRQVATLTSLARDAQEALALAKRAVPDRESLTPEVLLAAAWRTGHLDERFPALGPCLPDLPLVHESEPPYVQVAEPLRPLLRAISAEHNASVQTMVKILLLGPAVQGYLTERGMDQGELSRVVTQLRAAPSAVTVPAQAARVGLGGTPDRAGPTGAVGEGANRGRYAAHRRDADGRPPPLAAEEPAEDAPPQRPDHRSAGYRQDRPGARVRQACWWAR